MHYWRQPYFKDNVLKYFCILNEKNQLVVSEVMEQLGKFFLAVVVAKLKRNMLIEEFTVDDIVKDVTVVSDLFFSTLSFKYYLNHIGKLSVRVSSSNEFSPVPQLSFYPDS